MTAVRWQILGSTTVTVDGRAIALSPRSRAVLLRLLVEPNAAVSLDAIADFVWDGELPKTYRNSVARFVADLRTRLGAARHRLVSLDGGYLLEVEPGELDSDLARAAIEDARRLEADDLDGALAAANAALAAVGTHHNRWLDDRPATAGLVRARDELHIAALDTLAAICLRGGRPEPVIAALEDGVDLHPYNERLWQHLAEALRQTGRSADALRVIGRLRDALAEIGLVVSDATQQLEHRVLGGAGSGVDVDALDIVAPVGRSADLRVVVAAMTAHQCVSIVGAEGIGKSHLLRAVTRELRFGGDVVHELDVQRVSQAGDLVALLAVAVGVPPATAVTDVPGLAAQLVAAPCVIALDNVHRHRVAVRSLVDELVPRVPNVRFVLTVRSPLALRDHHGHRLGPISTRRTTAERPSPSATLFQTRAPWVDATIDDIEALCERVGGHPLGIHVAAGITRTVSVAALTESLPPRSSPADAVAAVLQVAWSILSDAQQSGLARLSVFPGGCTAEAAQAVAKLARPDLDVLVDRGLVERSGQRFELTEMIRRSAARHLDERCETDVTRDRMARWLRSLTDETGSTGAGCSARISALLLAEVDNITATLVHLRAKGRVEELVDLAMRSSGMWINHGRLDEINRWLGPVVDDHSIPSELRSGAAAALVEAALAVGKFEMMGAWSELSLELADGRPLDWVPVVAGFLALWSLVVPQARTTEEFLDLATTTAPLTLSTTENIAMALMRRAHIAHHSRQHDVAVGHFRDALALVSEPGRLRLALEMGETISLYNGGRKREAHEAMNRWVSEADTDEWHYQVDIIRALVVGGCGNPGKATEDLAAALRRSRPISVWARADEFQLAFGMLADLRGERDLADELLATPMSGSPFLTSMVAQHIAESRGFDSDGLEAVARSVAARNLPAMRRPDHRSDVDLVAWWESGRTSPRR